MRITSAWTAMTRSICRWKAGSQALLNIPAKKTLMFQAQKDIPFLIILIHRHLVVRDYASKEIKHTARLQTKSLWKMKPHSHGSWNPPVNPPETPLTCWNIKLPASHYLFTIGSLGALVPSTPFAPAKRLEDIYPGMEAAGGINLNKWFKWCNMFSRHSYCRIDGHFTATWIHASFQWDNEKVQFIATVGW